MPKEFLDVIPLSQLPIGKKGMVVELLAEGLIRHRMLDLVILRNTIIEAKRRSPAGDPTAYEIRGTIIGLRKEDACLIRVKPLEESGGNGNEESTSIS